MLFPEVVVGRAGRDNSGSRQGRFTKISTRLGQIQ